MLPTRIKVGPHWLRVIAVPGMADWNETMGSTWSRRDEIRIDTEMPPLHQGETLLHEFLHLAADFVGIGKDEPVTQEAWVTRVAPALYMILKENGFLQFGAPVTFTWDSKPEVS